MNKREKVAISFIFAALGISLAMFAWSSLASYLLDKGRDSVALIYDKPIVVADTKPLLEPVILNAKTGDENTETSKPQVTPSAGQVGACTRRILPHKTLHVKVAYLEKGQTKIIEGLDGYVEQCGPGANGAKPQDITSTPIDKVVLEGTEEKSLPTKKIMSGLLNYFGL